MTKKPIARNDATGGGYDLILADLTSVIEAARSAAARTVNAVMTAAYWLIGRRIVESEQAGKTRAEYGEALIERLSADLLARYGRGFSVRNVWQMKAFYLAWPDPGFRSAKSRPREILQTPSAESEDSGNLQTRSAESSIAEIAHRFPLPWSAYVLLLSVKNASGRHFYETEALRGGWSVRQLRRQIDSQFYERTALSVARREQGLMDRPNGGAIEVEKAGRHGQATPPVMRWCGAEGARPARRARRVAGWWR